MARTGLALASHVRWALPATAVSVASVAVIGTIAVTPQVAPPNEVADLPVQVTRTPGRLQTGVAPSPTWPSDSAAVEFPAGTPTATPGVSQASGAQPSPATTGPSSLPSPSARPAPAPPWPSSTPAPDLGWRSSGGVVTVPFPTLTPAPSAISSPSSSPRPSGSAPPVRERPRPTVSVSVWPVPDQPRMPQPVPEELLRGLQCRIAGGSGIVHMSFVPPRGMEIDEDTTVYLLDAQGNQPQDVSFVRERRRIRLKHPVRVRGAVTCVVSWRSVVVSKSAGNTGLVRGSVAPSGSLPPVVPVDPSQPDSPVVQGPGVIPVLHVVEDLVWLIAGG